MTEHPSVGYVGLTHLGLTYLAASTIKGFNVIGIDLNKNKVEQLKKFNISYDEPNLKKTIIKNRKKITFSSNLRNLKNCKIVFVSKDVATDNKGKGDFNSLKKLINKTSKFLNKKTILIILSQVRPGFTRMVNFDNSRLYYQVETLVFGKALERACKPERIIIGCKNSNSNIKNFFFKLFK